MRSPTARISALTGANSPDERGSGFVLALIPCFIVGVLAAGLGAISYTLAFLPVVAFACWVRGWKTVSALILIVYVGGFVGNFLSNYGLSAAIFKGEIVQAENKNQTHADRRAVVVVRPATASDADATSAGCAA